MAMCIFCIGVSYMLRRFSNLRIENNTESKSIDIADKWLHTHAHIAISYIIQLY